MQHVIHLGVHIVLWPKLAAWCTNSHLSAWVQIIFPSWSSWFNEVAYTLQSWNHHFCWNVCPPTQKKQGQGLSKRFLRNRLNAAHNPPFWGLGMLEDINSHHDLWRPISPVTTHSRNHLQAFRCIRTMARRGWGKRYNKLRFLGWETVNKEDRYMIYIYICTHLHFYQKVPAGVWKMILSFFATKHPSRTMQMLICYLHGGCV